jgi:hypothetical protein
LQAPRLQSLQLQASPKPLLHTAGVFRFASLFFFRVMERVRAAFRRVMQ